MNSYELVPAFADSVADSQHVFRVLLKSLSEPGLSHCVDRTDSLAELCQAGYGMALTLLDSSTPVWLSPALSSSKIQQNLSFHTGCQIVDEPEQALFAFLCEEEIGYIKRLNVGTDRDPEFSCTAIVQKNDLDTGAQQMWSGPGILEQRLVNLDIDAEFWSIRAQKTAFPRGIDVFFVAKDRVLGLPRTTLVQVAQGSGE